MKSQTMYKVLLAALLAVAMPLALFAHGTRQLSVVSGSLSVVSCSNPSLAARVLTTCNGQLTTDN